MYININIYTNRFMVCALDGISGLLGPPCVALGPLRAHTDPEKKPLESTTCFKQIQMGDLWWVQAGYKSTPRGPILPSAGASLGTV